MRSFAEGATVGLRREKNSNVYFQRRGEPGPQPWARAKLAEFNLGECRLANPDNGR
jgi:hypothetical protein